MENDLLNRPVKKALVSMTAPVIIGMLITFLFQLVDTYFVGKLGTVELASISFAYPVYLLIVSLFIGIASGVSATVAKALGEKNKQKAKDLSTISLIIFMLITLAIGVAGYFTISPVFSLLGAKENTLPLIAEYMQVLYLGMFALVGTLIGNSALMAKGIMVKTTIIMGFGGLINLVLDYILIFGMGFIPAMELEGAALATVISWFITLVIMTTYLAKEDLLSFSQLRSVKKVSYQLREIFSISSPAVVAQLMNPVAIAVVTRLTSTSGDHAVAAYGIASRVEMLGLTGVLALSVILTPFTAQNFGAKRQDRLDQAIAYSGRMTVYWGIALYVFILLFAKMIASLFTSDINTIIVARNYLYILGISFPGFGLALITTSFFNGVYQPGKSLKLTLIKSVGFTIPLAIVGSLFSLNGIWIGLAVANVLAAVYAGKVLNRWLAENNSDLPGRSPVFDYIDDFKTIWGKIT